MLSRLATSLAGLTATEAGARLASGGPNVLGTHDVTALDVFGRQLRNPLLILLAAAAIVSFLLGEHTDGAIILVISGLSVGLSFVNEYRSERAAADLHGRITHRALTVRDGKPHAVEVTELVPGDVVLLDVGEIVPADIRLIETSGLECDEAVITGEAMPAGKSVLPAPAGATGLDLPSCVLMGTVVKTGRARGVVVQTGGASTFGQIASRLGRAPAETAFQAGLRGFSVFLVYVTAVLAVAILALNWLLGHPFLDSALFALAIAVGMTPQLLPAVVTVSLSLGARRLAARSVLVKRLISIEDLGNITVLFTDKTGTLTEGRINLLLAADASGTPSPAVLRLGLICNSAVLDEGGVPRGNPLDVAIWEAPGAGPELVRGVRRLAETAFSYEQQRMTVVIEESGQRRVITKGAPEAVLTRCVHVPPAAHLWLASQFDSGRRVVAVASRWLGADDPAADERLQLDGFLVFIDPLKPSTKRSLARLKTEGIEVKIVTGDNERVASRLCTDAGLHVKGILGGSAIEAMDDTALTAALPQTTIFGRVTPEQKSRVIRLERARGSDVGFLGDGVNDAIALHDADVGISVDSAADVAKDAADIVLLTKDLGILADGVLEGRRIFANTIKYVLMGTSSSFGNMFSAAGASVFLPFLPMTATQILLTNLLYYTSQLTIPTDRVDAELVRRPAHWDVGFIRRFMILFGPISSIFDFLTFAVMLGIFHAQAALFQSGWFVESLATQTLVIFVIRTRRVPFLRSTPSVALAGATLGCVAVGALLPFSPLASVFGMQPLPPLYFAVLGGMVVAYLALAEGAKLIFYRLGAPSKPLSVRLTPRNRRAHRILTRWWTVGPVARPRGGRRRPRAARG
ncbi:MAG: magnesium-translocating P-type ATPase [Chloroflexota bacterium]|nr:magnesium-translocating P-type ATPase [Chloroflexota bacterium]